MSICIIAGLVALIVSMVLTPWVRKAAIRLGVGDYPGTRKVNKVFMPRLGGLAFIAGSAAGLVTASLLLPGGILPRIDGGLSLAVALALIIGLGIYDDVHGVGSLGKLIVQTIAALFVIGSGLQLETLNLPFSSPIHLGVAGPVLTLIWLIGITNAVNLLDGLDGLAAGVSILVGLSFLAIGIHTQDWVIIASTVSLIAACIGFLRYNFHPASIFMGDTGSLFLGFFLATLSLRIVHGHAGQDTPVSLLAVAVALAVPVVDTSVAFFRRLRKGMHPLKPDKEHIHHRIMDLGFTHRQTVVTIYAVSAFNSVISLLLVQLDSMYAVVLLLVEVLVVFFGIRRLGYIEEMRSRRGLTEQAIQPLSVARVIERFVLLFGDTVALVLAFIAAYSFRFASGSNPEGFVPFDVYFNSPAMLILTLGWLAAFALAGLYDIPWDASRIDYVVNILRVVIVGTVVVFIVTYDPEVMTLKGRLATFVYGGTVASFVITIRMVIVGIERRYNILGFRPRSTLLVGVSRAAESLLDDIARRPGLKYVLVGFVEREPHVDRFRGLPALGSYKDIPEVVRKHLVEEILVAADYVSREEILEIVAQCNGMVPNIKVVPESLNVLGGFKFQEVVGHPLIRLQPTNLNRWQWIVKRTIDILVSLLVLVPFLPLWLIVGAIIRIDSPGPIFFVQERVGKKGRIFTLYKFRSMIPDAERDTGPIWAQPDDIRVTRFGRVLRKLRVDEVPQFFNVLKGEMSLVGPRPERPFFVELLRKEVNLYGRRLLVRPGITGWAQVRHRYDRSLEDVKEKIKYDLYYLENMSLTLDLKIIFRTIFVALSGTRTH